MDSSSPLQFSLPCFFPTCQFLQYDAASSGGTKDTQLRESGSAGPNPTEPEPGWEGRAGFPHPRHSTLPQPSRHTGLGRYLETPPDMLLSLGNSLTHRGTLAGEGTSSAGPGFVNPALLFCLNYPFQGPKAGGLPLGPRGLAEVLGGPCGFRSVPALGSGRAKGTHAGVSPGIGAALGVKLCTIQH